MCRRLLQQTYSSPTPDGIAVDEDEWCRLWKTDCKKRRIDVDDETSQRRWYAEYTQRIKRSDLGVARVEYDGWPIPKKRRYDLVLTTRHGQVVLREKEATVS